MADETATVTESASTAPVVVEKKKKKKYTSGLRDVQELATAANKAHSKLAGAIHDAVNEWVDRSSSSSNKRKDGMLKDTPLNLGRTLTKGVEKAMKAPEKFMDEFEETRLYKKRIKKFKLM